MERLPLLPRKEGEPLRRAVPRAPALLPAKARRARAVPRALKAPPRARALPVRAALRKAAVLLPAGPKRAVALLKRGAAHQKAPPPARALHPRKADPPIKGVLLQEEARAAEVKEAKRNKQPQNLGSWHTRKDKGVPITEGIP